MAQQSRSGSTVVMTPDVQARTPDEDSEAADGRHPRPDDHEDQGLDDADSMPRRVREELAPPASDRFDDLVALIAAKLTEEGRSIRAQLSELAGTVAASTRLATGPVVAPAELEEVEYLRSARRRDTEEIQNLREENRGLRLGIGREVLHPVLMHVLRVFDEASELSLGEDASSRVAAILRDSLHQAIAAGFDARPYSAQPGDAVDPELHQTIRATTISDPGSQAPDTIASTHRPGFRTGAGAVVRKCQVAVFR